MNCPHCHKPISADLVKSAAARMAQKKRVYRLVERPCPKCGGRFGARELRKHIPRCKA